MSNTLPTTVVCPCCAKVMKVTKTGKISAHKHPRIPGNRGSAPGSNVSIDPAKIDETIAKLTRNLDWAKTATRPNPAEIDAVEKTLAWARSI